MFGLPVILYLFLGGAGAGLACAMAACELLPDGFCAPSSLRGRLGSARRVWARNGYVAATVMLVAGVLCLMADLGRPQAAYLVFVFPHVTYITLGSYGLVALTACTALLALGSVCSFAPRVRRLASALPLAVLPLALFVMVYTGLFLSGMGSVPLWNAPFLPPLFLVSALSVGLALAMACRPRPLRSPHAASDIAGIAARAELVCLGLEVVFAAGQLVCAAGAPCGLASVGRLLAGDMSAAFLAGYAACGLAVPLACCIGRLRGGFLFRSHALEAACISMGGFCLRFAIVCAGVHVSG